MQGTAMFAGWQAFDQMTGGAALSWVHFARADCLVAAAVVALLLVSIRNAWDLVTWLAPRRDPSARDGSN